MSNKPKSPGKIVANFIINEVFRYVTTKGLEVKFPITPEALADLLFLRSQGVISSKRTKEIFKEMCSSGKTAREIMLAEHDTTK